MAGSPAQKSGDKVRGNIAVNEDDGAYFWIRQDLIIRDSKGAIVFVQPGVLDIKKPVSEKPSQFINDRKIYNNPARNRSNKL
jgi:hypothetical protein